MSRFTWTWQDFLDCAPGWTLDARGRPVAPQVPPDDVAGRPVPPDGSAGDAHAPAVRVAPSASGSGRAAVPPCRRPQPWRSRSSTPPPCSAQPGAARPMADAAPGDISAADRWARALELRAMDVPDDLVLACVALTEAQRAAFLEAGDAAG